MHTLTESSSYTTDAWGQERLKHFHTYYIQLIGNMMKILINCAITDECADMQITTAVLKY